jgi:hypothetical protein|tara:strand:- start:194 stop:1150 length:957 start_codon:yes stop_codon:yes gene_type:complete
MKQALRGLFLFQYICTVKQFLFIKTATDVVSLPASALLRAEYTSDTSVSLFFETTKSGKNATTVVVLSVTSGTASSVIKELSLSTITNSTFVFEFDDVNNKFALKNVTGISSITTTEEPTITGADGANGTNGQGVPTGGAAGATLIKSSATDYDTSWSSKFIQVYNMNFFDDLSTLKHYMPWKDINEQSQNYQDESAFLMPYDGRIVSVSLKISSVTADGDITIGIESLPTGSNPFVFPGDWTIEETEVMSATSTDDHHTFHFVFSNASHFEAGDTVALTIQNSVDITGTAYIHATAIVEWDTSANLGSSSTEHETNP